MKYLIFGRNNNGIAALPQVEAEGAAIGCRSDAAQRALAEMKMLAPKRALFALTLAWTGARVSEVLDLRAYSFQIERGIVAIRTLKRRRPCVREVPIPPELMAALTSSLESDQDDMTRDGQPYTGPLNSNREPR